MGPSISKAQRPHDPNLLAGSVVEDLTARTGMEASYRQSKPERKKNPTAVALSKLGAPKGGRARVESLSVRKRRMIAKKAAQARCGR
jgi:hypothetical protein